MAQTEIVRGPNGEFGVSSFTTGTLPAVQGAAATGDKVDLGKFLDRSLAIQPGEKFAEQDMRAGAQLLAEAREQMGLKPKF